MAHPSLKCKNLLFVRLIFQQPNYECPFRFSKESRKKPAFLPTKKREKLCVVHATSTRTGAGVVFKRRKNSHMGKAWKHDEFCVYAVLEVAKKKS